MWPGLQALNEDGCMLGAKIVWITLMETRSVRRWAACEYCVLATGDNAGTSAGVLFQLLNGAVTTLGPDTQSLYAHPHNSAQQPVHRQWAAIV